jgi:transcriptional regulator with XRE-family HTH domain
MSRWSGQHGMAARLDKLLEKQGISSAEIARGLKLDRSTVSKYRDGSRVPDVEAFVYMIKMAGASADEVLGLKPLGSVPSRAGVIQALDEIQERVDGARQKIAEK